jgi:hypothetical protein
MDLIATCGMCVAVVASLSLQRVASTDDKPQQASWAINSSSDVFGNAPGMLSGLCSGFSARFLFVA